MSYFDMFLPKKETDNIMIAQDNNPFASRILSPKMKALLNNYTQAEKAKSAVTKQPSYTAEKKDSFLEGFNDPYGEKNAFPRQSLAQRMMAQFTNPTQQTPQSPMIKTEEPKYTFPFAENSKKNESTQKVEDDAFLEGFNYYNDKELMFPNTELRAKPKNYGIMFPNTQLHAGSSIKASERDAFLEGLGFSTDKELMFPNTELHAKPKNYGMMFPNTQLHASPSKNKSEDDAFKEGFNDPYGEKKEEKEKNWLQTGLDWMSGILTVASLFPAWDTASNALQLLVDLGRGDYPGAVLDLVGIIPYVGEVADVAKYSKAGNATLDGIQAADKVADGIKAAEAVSDGIKIADDVADGAKAVDKAHDAAKTTEKIEDIVDIPNIHYPGDDPTISPGKDFEWRGKADPSTGNGAWYNPKTGESMHWDLNHADPIGPHWDYIDPEGNRFRVFKDGRIEFSGK